MSHALLDEETLEALVYERSKSWSSMMKHCGEAGDGNEVDLGDIEKLYKGEERDPDVQEDEEAAEDELLETDLGMGNVNATAAMSKAELTMILCAGENKEKTAEMEEILNQTMPIVQEHKRKWKAAGLDQILDTFDAQKIEQHVGQWMRRNNSVYLEESSQRYDCSHERSHSDPSDNESLHSIDTARYIMQSRKRSTPIPKMTNMTTIKMYRTHSRKRDELRAKYAYDDEQEHRHHMQALLHRRRERERKLAYLTSSPRHYSYSSSSHHSHHTRLKHLRKRRADSSLFGSPSSEDEDATLSGCDCRSCLKRVLTRSAYECCSYRGQREYHHQAASSRSMHRVRRPQSFQEELDLRPRLMENECSCCNSDRLCADVVHIANSSTEEWVVENCNSPVPTGTPTKCSNRLTCIKKHFTLRKTPQTVRSKCRDRVMGSAPHRLIRKATSAAALYTPRREGTRLVIRNLIDSDTSDEDARKERRKPLSGAERREPHTPAISSVENASKKKAKPMNLPPISKVVAKKTNSEDEMAAHELQAVPEDDSSDENELRGRSRLMSFSEVKQKKVAKTRKAVKPKSSVEKAPKKKTMLSGKSKSLPPISEDVAKTKDSSSLPKILDDDGAKPVRGVTLEVGRIKSVTSEDEKSLMEPKKMGPAKEIPKASVAKNKPCLAPTIPTTDGDFFNSQNIVKTESPVEISTPVAPKEKRLTPRSSAKKKINSNCPSSLAQITEEVDHSPDSQCTPNGQAAKMPVLKLKRCTVPKNAEAASSSSSDGDEWPLSTSRMKRVGQNTTTLNDTDEEMGRALALSKETYRKEQLKRRPDQRSKPDPQSTAQQQSPSQSLFHNNSVACNSTALANDTACTRVLPNKQRVKRRSAVSSSEQETKPDTIIILDSSTETVPDEESNKAGGEADCTVVTSTTSCEAKEEKAPPFKFTKRGILLHSSSTSVGSGNFTLNEQDLGRIIGERRARKYLKYHIGSRSFDGRHSVYYRPTPKLAAALSASPDSAHTLVHELHTSSSSSSSEEDIFEHIQRYGEVYSVLGNPKED
ncbi:uncharacterized protein LOC121403833 [Drosophila obscura]|uniref:uncharacterized protein LOC121403833 n=1 Tax=Drosophila obscura TaxID=7282 RepID=UPI001BB13544|nr:uncharacterized protein LOC121403833 [Drosophila obscura]